MNSDLEGSLEAVRASLERLAQSGEEAVRNVGEPVQLDLSTGDATVDRGTGGVGAGLHERLSQCRSPQSIVADRLPGNA